MLLGTAKIEDALVKQLRSRIGIDLRITQFNTEASQRSIERFVRAIGDDNPLWMDAHYTRNTRYGCIIAPHHFYILLSSRVGR